MPAQWFRVFRWRSGAQVKLLASDPRFPVRRSCAGGNLQIGDGSVSLKRQLRPSFPSQNATARFRNRNLPIFGNSAGQIESIRTGEATSCFGGLGPSMIVSFYNVDGNSATRLQPVEKPTVMVRQAHHRRLPGFPISNRTTPYKGVRHTPGRRVAPPPMVIGRPARGNDQA